VVDIFTAVIYKLLAGSQLIV